MTDRELRKYFTGGGGGGGGEGGGSDGMGWLVKDGDDGNTSEQIQVAVTEVGKGCWMAPDSGCDGERVLVILH